jgi:hypothetical protein
MDTRVSSFCFVQSVTIIPSGTSSKKHQSAEKVSRRPQILVFCGHPFSLVYSDAIFDRQKLMRSALLNDVSKTNFSCYNIEAIKYGL